MAWQARQGKAGLGAAWQARTAIPDRSYPDEQEPERGHSRPHLGPVVNALDERRAVRAMPVLVTANRPGGPTSKTSTMYAHFNETDPAAVILAVVDPWANPRDVVEYVLARNLLIAAHLPGLSGEIVGLGDIKVRYDAVIDQTEIWLDPPGASASLVFNGEQLVDLLREAAEIVPLGLAESAIYDAAVDAEIADLLDSAS